jgi:hypothetical protein
MTIHVKIELSEQQAAALQEKAFVRGVTVEDWIEELVQNDSDALPYKTGYGMLAKYGPAPSSEEIDENRREMMLGFGEDC